MLQGVSPTRDVLDEDVHEFGPLIARQLDRSNRNDQGSSGVPSSGIGRVQGLERELLDLRLGLGVDLLNPSKLHFTQLGLVSEGESVLQGDTGSDTNVRGAVFVGQFLTEGDEVGSLRHGSC